MLSLDEIQALIKMVEESSINKLEVKCSEYSIKMDKKAAAAAPPPANTTVVVTGDSAKGAVEESYTEITAPMIGTFYLTPEPGAAPFVKVGTRVAPDSVVCILEAMKLFTEIEAECSGEIVEILVKNGEFVEYGQPLFRVRA